MNNGTLRLVLLSAAALVIPLALPTSVVAEPPTISVTVKDNAFDPPLLQIAAGTTVTWRNTGNMYHTVTLTLGTTGDAFDLPLEPGATAAYTFATAGVVLYHCVPHQLPQNGNMRAAIVVA